MRPELLAPEKVHTPGCASPGCEQDAHEESAQIENDSALRGMHTLFEHVDGAKQLEVEPLAIKPHEKSPASASASTAAWLTSLTSAFGCGAHTSMPAHGVHVLTWYLVDPDDGAQ